MRWLKTVTLQGSYAVLEPLSESHGNDLIAAVRDGDLWKLWYTSVPEPARMSEEIARRLALRETGSMLPFAVIERASGVAVGMTSYMNVDAENRRVEIGSTWYCERVQRTALNTDCKLLLLRHAFETLDCIAVEFRTSSLNFASRRAIERLGAKLDGVLRSHMVHAHVLRDTCVYSIIAAEWPTIETHLSYQLERRPSLNRRSSRE